MRGLGLPKAMRPLPEISAFFPAFNEEGNIRRMVEGLREVLPQVASRHEIVIVDDGSRDKTGVLAEDLARRHPQVRVVRHKKNRGYGAAVRSGISACRYGAVFFTDGDCQFDLSELKKLVPHLASHDIVSGFRVRRRDNPLRRLYSRGWNWLIRRLLGVEARDVNCAFKLFKASVFDGMKLRTTGAMINAEILHLAQERGCTLYEVPVSHRPRLAGRQTGGNPRVILRAFWELLKFRMGAF